MPSYTEEDGRSLTPAQRAEATTRQVMQGTIKGNPEGITFDFSDANKVTDTVQQSNTAASPAKEQGISTDELPTGDAEKFAPEHSLKRRDADQQKQRPKQTFRERAKDLLEREKALTNADTPAQRAQATTQQVMQPGTIQGKPEGISFNQASSITNTVQQSNTARAPQKSLDIPTEELPIGDAEKFDPKESLKQHDADQQKSSSRSSVRQRWESLKTALKEIPTMATELKAEIDAEKPPDNSSFTRKVARLATRQNPLGRYATTAYDGYKTAEEFIKYAKHIREQELLRHGSENKPFYLIEAAEKDNKLAKLDKDIEFWKSFGQTKPEYSHNGSFESQYIHQKNIDALYKKGWEIKDIPPTLEAALSQKASKINPEITQKFVQDSAFNASEYAKQVMQGDAQHKYHWLFQEVKKELGEDYFNTATHPQRSLLFDRWASEHLRVSGYSNQEVHQAIEKGLCCSVLYEKRELVFEQQQHQYLAIADHGIKEQVMQRTVGVQSRDFEEKQIIANAFQRQEKLTTKDTKITPEEYRNYQNLKAAAEHYKITKNIKVHDDAIELLEQYTYQKGQENFTQTHDQFLLDYGKELVKGKSPDINEISYKLYVAGHEKNNIINILTENHPDLNQSTEAAQRLFKSVEDATRQNPLRRQEVYEISNFKKDTGLVEEKRLDRLPFHETRPEPIKTQQQGSYQDRSNIGHSTVTPIKDQEQELNR